LARSCSDVRARDISVSMQRPASRLWHSTSFVGAFVLAMSIFPSASVLYQTKPSPALRAGSATSVLEIGHKSAQLPELPATLGQLPHLAPIFEMPVVAPMQNPSLEAPGHLTDVSPGGSPGATVFFRSQGGSNTGPVPAPAFAAAPVPAPAAGPMIPAGMAPDPNKFWERLSNLLTCEDLERLVFHSCNSQPLSHAIVQFEQNSTLCDVAVQKIAELGHVFVEYFGQGANCNTQIEMWKFAGYSSPNECYTTIRTEKFKYVCKLPFFAGANGIS